MSVEKEVLVGEAVQVPEDTESCIRDENTTPPVSTEGDLTVPLEDKIVIEDQMESDGEAREVEHEDHVLRDTPEEIADDAVAAADRLRKKYDEEVERVALRAAAIVTKALETRFLDRSQMLEVLAEPQVVSWLSSNVFRTTVGAFDRHGLHAGSSFVVTAQQSAPLSIEVNIDLKAEGGPAFTFYELSADARTELTPDRLPEPARANLIGFVERSGLVGAYDKVFVTTTDAHLMGVNAARTELIARGREDEITV